MKPLFKSYEGYAPGVAGMFVLACMLLIGALAGNAVSLVVTFLYKGPEALELATLLGYPVMFIPAMLYARSARRVTLFGEKGVALDSSHFGQSGPAVCFVIASVATLALGFCSDALTSLLPEMPERLENLMKKLTGGNFWINIISVGLFAPFFEEWLCRGMVLRGLLANRIKPVWAIVISATFFAVIHANPWQAIPAFILGCLFGYFYFKTGSLKLTMLMHCVNNSFAVVLMHCVPSLESMESWMDVLPGQKYWIIFAASILVLALSVLAFRKIPLEKPEGNMD